MKRPITVTKLNLLQSIFFLKKNPLTCQKGLRGKGTNTQLLVNQRRAKGAFWLKTNTASRFFQKAPLVLYSTRTSLLMKAKFFFFKSSGGLLLALKNLNLKDFGFYFYNFKSILPTFSSTSSAKQLLFVKVGTVVTKLCDLFAARIVFATAFRSKARVMFFDR